jgi:UDP-N-acetylglucosamine 4,6-dehydratase
MDITKANLCITGGAGTLGRAIARRRAEEGWTGRLTVYSTDDHKHDFMRRLYPDVQYIQGDIRNPETLYMAMCGHDVCIHAAAVKVIPVSEYASIDTFDVNVNGSLIVFHAALRAGIEHVLAISTDKACHSANAYGSTKYMMEKAAQEYSRASTIETEFHLVRYGNVLESTGSVIEFWRKAMAAGEPIKITDPEMTRFWLSPSQAVDMVIESLRFKSGQIFIPKMPALSIGKLAEYVLGGADGDLQFTRIPLRPGEKMHETLLTLEELEYARDCDTFFLLDPTTGLKSGTESRPRQPYTSDTARELTQDELTELLND